MTIKVVDNLVPKNEQYFIEHFLKYDSKWVFLKNSKDRNMMTVHAMRYHEIYNLTAVKLLEFLFLRFIEREFPGKEYDLHKILINGQYKQHETEWHTDVDYHDTDYNLIYHVNTEWDSKIDGGEFETRDQVVSFVPGRFVLVPADTEHKGRSPTSDKFRMSVAWTFGIYDKQETV